MSLPEPPGVPLRQTLPFLLRDRQRLLVLDNFEHLLTAADVVAFLLQAGPGLRLLVTSRDFASSYNRVFSLDTRLKLNANWTLDGQVMDSETRDLDGTRLSGPAYLARISHDGKHFNYSTMPAEFFTRRLMLFSSRFLFSG